MDSTPSLLPNLVVFGIILLILAALLIERKPGGGFRLSRRLELFQEFWEFIRERKLWWLTPILLIMASLGIFIVMTEKSAIMPLVYAMF